MKRKFTISFLLGSLLLVGVSDAQGQHWKQLSVPYDSAFISPYFINTDTGFIFNPRAIFYNANHSHPFRTTDGGSSWTAIPYFDSAGVAVQQIYFESATKGYIAASDGVYETENTGMTWRKIYKDSVTFSSVYAFGGKVFAYANQAVDVFYSIGIGPLISTTNDGNSWDTIIDYKPSRWTANIVSLSMPYVFGNKDGLVFAADFDTLANAFIIFSTDNGNKWKSRILDTTWNRTVGLFSFAHCNDLLRILHTQTSEDEYDIEYSTDTAKTWDSVFLAEIGAWVGGNDCVQYINDALGNQNNRTDRIGLWRSLNHGKNWEYVDGPNNTEIDDWDYPNISTVGGGAVVYLTATAGFAVKNGFPYNTFWKTTDGGDGTLSISALASRISLDHNLTQGATFCDTSNLSIIFQNLSCNYSLLKNFTIDGLDSTQYSSRLMHHLACDDIPDSILIKIFPLYINGGGYTFRGHFINDEYEIIDTSFTFILSPTTVQYETIYLKSTPLSNRAGDTTEIPVYINSAQSLTQPGATAVTITYSLNTNLLTPFFFIPISGITADPVQTTKKNCDSYAAFRSKLYIQRRDRTW